MTLTCFALQNVPSQSAWARMAMSSLVPDGGGFIHHGDFNVAQTGTPSMQVVVGPGRAWIDGSQIGHVSGGGFGDQGQYFVMNDANLNVTVATSDPTNPRIDVVYAAVQDAYYSGASNQPVITVATGTPSPSASYPASAPTLPANSIALAWIYVGHSVSSITNANITILNPPAIIMPTAAPYGMAAGQVTMSVSSGGNLVNTSVSLPAGRFLVAPRVVASISNAPGASQKFIARTYGASTTGFSVELISGDGSTAPSAFSLTVDWIAIQMTGTSASG